MADLLDIAQERQEHTLNSLIEKARFKVTGVSAFCCVDCDAVIPEARRIALPGVTHCVSCQQKLEAQRKHFKQ